MVNLREMLEQIFVNTDEFESISRLMELRDYDKAKDECQFLIDKYPRVTSLEEFKRGISCLKVGDYDKAGRQFVEAQLAEDPYHVFAYGYWARVAETESESVSKTVSDWLEKLLYELVGKVESGKDDVLIHPQAKVRYFILRCQEDICLEQYKAAWEDISKACELDTTNKEATYQKDLTEYLLGCNKELDEIIQNRIESLEINDAYRERYHILLGQIYYTRREYGKAVYQYKFAVNYTSEELSKLREEEVIPILQRKYELGLIYTKQAALLDPSEGRQLLELAEEEADAILTYLGVHPSAETEILKGKTFLLKGACLEELWDSKKESSNDTGNSILKIYDEAMRIFEKPIAPVYHQLAKDAYDSFELRKTDGRGYKRDNLINKIMGNEDMIPLERYVLSKKAERSVFLQERLRRPIKKNAKPIEPTFYILQRWNSYTPILGDHIQAGFVNETRGGGYFIETEEDGIVIDPGFDFIFNFIKEGFLFGDIDYILLTHAHNDHTADFESLLTLLYTYNKQIIGEKYDNELDRSVFQNVLCRNPYLSEDEIEKLSEQLFAASSRRKELTLIMPTGTYRKYESLINLDKGSYHKLVLVDDGTEEIRIGMTITLKPIPAKHDDQISDNQSKGYLLLISDNIEVTCALIYTGDSGFDRGVGHKYEEVADFLEREHPNANRILLAHIGSFKHRERYGYFEVTDNPSGERESKAFYPNHLGRLGLARIVDIIEPHYCIVSEFGEEFRGSISNSPSYSPRVKLCTIFNEEFENYCEANGRVVVPRFIPADIGFYWNLGRKFAAGFHKSINSNKRFTGKIDENVKTGELIYRLKKPRNRTKSSII